LRARLDILDGDAVQRVKEGLSDIGDQRDRLYEKYVQTGMSKKAVAKLEPDLDEREAGLSRQLADFGLDRIGELERTQRMLRGATDWQKTLAERQRLGIPADLFSIDLDMAESDDHIEFRAEKVMPVATRRSRYTHERLSTALDRIDAEIVAFPDHVEVRGVVAFDATLELSEETKDPQLPHPSRRLG
jgi:hypothetical protein